MSVLDIGCNSGWFSFDLAERGARSVDGVDLRAHNIEQARFLRDYFGFDEHALRGGRRDVVRRRAAAGTSC